jgi:S-adenosylmethionine synthetase
MFEKVNCAHVDKVADRIAGAIVDIAYDMQKDPKIAVEVLIGHGNCYVIYESSVRIDEEEIYDVVRRITGIDSWYFEIDYNFQDQHLADNQSKGVRCGDNGIFMGCPITEEQRRLTNTMKAIYDKFTYDGKAVLDDDRIILCQSHVDDYHELLPFLDGYGDYLINPLGPWTGGPDVDTGATNRKLGSDMGDAVTGGGLHGKDLSKADVSVNIACHLLAQAHGQVCTASCAIGDDEVTFRFEDEDMKITEPYENIVEMARSYVNDLGGFERLAEWGLI